MFEVIKIAHRIVAWAAFLFTLTAAGIYTYEKSRSFQDYIEYFHIVPYKIQYDSGQYAKFHSFYDSKTAVDIEWQEIIWCDVGNGAGFEYTETAPGFEFDFLVDRKYTPEIMELLHGISAGTVAKTLKLDDALRQYAIESQEDGFGYSKITAWRLNIKQPIAGSVCYGRHKIRILTPYFGIEKNYELYSGRWTYGTREE